MTTDVAIEALWPAGAPPTAAKVLQNHVVRLRKSVGVESVETTPTGYRLLMGTDAQRFTVLAARAPAEALALWRGRPWDDLDDFPPAMADAARLEEVRRMADEAVVAVSLDPIEGRRLVDEDPLREARWCLLLHALYRSGRQVEALRTAQEARRYLAENVGCEPGPDLREMEAAVARHDPALGPVVVAELDPEIETLALGRGREALAAEEPVSALRWLRLAGTTVESLIALGRAQLAVGEVLGGRATLIAAYTAAQQRGRVDLEAEVLSTWMFNSGTVGPSDDIIRAFESVMARRSQLADSARADLCSAWVAYASSFRAVRTFASTAEEAVAFARRSGDPQRVARACAASTLLHSRPHDADRRLAAAHAIANARQALAHDEPFCRWYQWWAERSALIELGDPSELEIRAGMLELAQSNRHAVDAFIAATWGQGLELRLGDFERADTMAADWAAGMAGHDDPAVVAELTPVYRTTIRWMQGRLAELRDDLERLASKFEFLVPLRSAWALSCAQAGDVTTATALAQPLLEGGLGRGTPEPQWSCIAVHLTDLTVHLARRDWAQMLIEELEPVTDRHAIFAGKHLGSFAHHLGLLHGVVGDRRSAIAAFRYSADANDHLGSTWWADASRRAAQAVHAAD
ncbi:MAG TPA: BTAD domain-containing putative transcriptional regulator [Acidimicrobiales bacterium]|nr:BTAD domain-containing putative transcriptional regulator [Acidimicrobiales bacterium]